MRMHIRRFAVLLTFSSFASILQAAGLVELAQAEIDRTVWQPFQCAFENMDGNALNELYADRVLRVTPAGIDTQSAFKLFNETRFNESMRNGDRIELDFWLDSRATNSDTSYDVGFFRLGTTDINGATEYYYGQFHIVLRKQRGLWKIVQDWDTNTIAGRPIGAEDFAIGSARARVCSVSPGNQ